MLLNLFMLFLALHGNTFTLRLSALCMAEFRPDAQIFKTDVHHG